MALTTVIENHRDALKRLVAGLVAMAGFAGVGAGLVSRGDPPATLPRHLHRAILRLLRPAESATRRLAIALASSLPPPPAPRPPDPAKSDPAKSSPAKSTRAGAHKPKPASLLVRAGVCTGIVLRPGAPVPAALAHLVPAKAAPRPLSLPLVEPLPRWRVRRRWRPPAGTPRISMPGVTERAPVPAWRPPSPDDPLDAGRLGRRLAALARALDDLPGLARRFARWQARRHRAQAAGHDHRVTPLRVGRPPGGRLSCYDPDTPRRANIRDVDEILAHAHALAIYALARNHPAPDTS